MPVRVGITHEGRGASAWSGIPYGLATGIRSHGEEVVLVSSEVDEATRKVVNALGRIRPVPKAAPWLTAWRSLEVQRRRRQAGPVDVWVQMGSRVDPPKGPFVTFDDMTVAQLATTTYMDGVGASVRRSWMDRQASIYASARHCFIASDWASTSLKDDYGVPPTKISVVGFGRNHVSLPPADKDWSQPRFLWVGYEWDRKNGPAVVEAFRRLRTTVPGAELELVGRHPDIREPGVVGHGELPLPLVGAPAPMARILASATCLVLPSRSEAFGIVYVEAGASGVPSIGTTAGGASTAIGPGGVLVDPDDEAALLEAMTTMSDPATARRLGDLALAHSDRFTWPNIASTVLDRCGQIL